MPDEQEMRKMIKEWKKDLEKRDKPDKVPDADDIPPYPIDQAEANKENVNPNDNINPIPIRGRYNSQDWQLPDSDISDYEEEEKKEDYGYSQPIPIPRSNNLSSSFMGLFSK